MPSLASKEFWEKRQWISVTLILIAFGLNLGSWLVPVFAGIAILPQSFTVGPVTVRYYGIILATAVIVGWFLAMRRAPKYGLSPEQAEKIIFISLLAGLLGARLYHVASSWQYYWSNPQQILAFWNGGLSIYGALIGGVLALAWFARKNSGNRAAQLLTYLNWLTFSFLAGQIIGRFGNLFNYEAFGSPTDVLWKMYVPLQFRPSGFIDVAFYHPWFLYEVLLNLLIFVFLWRWKRSSGKLFLWYLLLYNVVRMLLEFLRIDSTFIGPIRLNAAVSGIITIIAGILLYYGKQYISQNSKRVS